LEGVAHGIANDEPHRGEADAVLICVLPYGRMLTPLPAMTNQEDLRGEHFPERGCNGIVGGGPLLPLALGYRIAPPRLTRYAFKSPAL
jgi:hypothetical protein